MPPNVDAMVREGINAYQTGNKNEARTLLFKAVELDEQHEQAWLWLSAVVDSIDDQQTCLENVLTINPSNERARQGLRILEQRRGSGSIAIPNPYEDSSASATVDEEDEDPFAHISFTDPLPQEDPLSFEPDPPQFDTLPEEEEENLSEPVDWSTIATSSASAMRPTNEPSPDDYDDWVANLNLKNRQSEGEDFDDGPFSSPFLLDETAREVFGFEDDLEEDPGELGFEEEDRFDMSGNFDNRLSPEPSPGISQTTASLMSPSSIEDDDDLDILMDVDELDDLDFDDDFDDIANGGIDPEEYFRSIPDEIRATRLPGSVERYPLLVILGLILFLAINAGAVALVLMTLTTA